MPDYEIRELTLDDLPEIICRVKDAANESGWGKQLKWDANHVAKNLISMVNRDDYMVVGTDDVGAIMIATVSRAWYSPSLQAKEMVFYVHPSLRSSGRAKALIAYYQEWAAEKGAKRLNIGINLGILPELGCKLCESMGFQHEGFTFMQHREN